MEACSNSNEKPSEFSFDVSDTFICNFESFQLKQGTTYVVDLGITYKGSDGVVKIHDQIKKEEDNDNDTFACIILDNIKFSEAFYCAIESNGTNNGFINVDIYPDQSTFLKYIEKDVRQYIDNSTSDSNNIKSAWGYIDSIDGTNNYRIVFYLRKVDVQSGTLRFNI